MSRKVSLHIFTILVSSCLKVHAGYRAWDRIALLHYPVLVVYIGPLQSGVSSHL